MLNRSQDQSSNGRILIVGGGPAGSATAFWLARAGFQVVVAEQSTCQPYGQGIDIQDEAVEVVRRMGLLNSIKNHTTGETGFSLLDDKGQGIATVGANPMERDDGIIISPTNEIEITRGTLTTVFADAAKELGVEYRYGCSITALSQSPTSVTATFSSNNNASESFTAIIGADGIGSKVRKLAFELSINETCYVPTNTYVAFYSMLNPNLSSQTSLFQHASKGRAIWIRPLDRQGHQVSTYLMITSADNASLHHAALSRSESQQKSLLLKLFTDLGGLGPAALTGIVNAKDFYFARLTQVKLPYWHVDRVALVGDAAYCPSPLCGGGNTLAILGAYILVGELSENPDDPAMAFEQYRMKLKEYVEQAGEIPLWGWLPSILTPQTQVGIWLLRAVFWVACNATVQWVFRGLSFFEGVGKQNNTEEKKERIQLPRYGFEVA